MRNRFRTTFATAAAAALVLGSAGLAVADSVSVTPADETKAPGEGGYFLVYLVAGSEDGDLNNCNVNTGNPGQVSFESDAPDVVASPGSVALAFCDDPTTTALEGAVAVSYEVAADAPDGATATITATASGGRSTGNNPRVYGTYSPDSFTLTVQAPAAENTPPQVSVTGFTDGDVFEVGSEPTPGCSVVDAEDGEQAVDPDVQAPVGPLSAYGLGTVTVTCSYTDTAGEAGTATASYVIEDTGAPVLTDLGPTAAPNGDNGWYTSAVTNTFRATDAGAGFETDSPRLLTMDITASSGPAEGAAVTVSSGPVSDVAGNTAASIDSQAFKIDLSDPTDVTFVGGIADGSSFPWGDTPDEPTCTATDAVSGLAGCVVSGYGTDVGNHTLTATATDNAGRTATATLVYTVDPWRHDGFYRPVDMLKLNTVKAGSTVPLKFNVYKGDAPVTDMGVLGASFTVKQISCDTGAPTDAVEEFSTTGGTTLRYDAEAQQWIQNWATPRAGKGSCYRVTVTTADDTSTSAEFRLK
jgi:hypothetical protein